MMVADEDSVEGRPFTPQLDQVRKSLKPHAPVVGEEILGLRVETMRIGKLAWPSWPYGFKIGEAMRDDITATSFVASVRACRTGFGG